jgi:hypothetical protein
MLFFFFFSRKLGEVVFVDFGVFGWRSGGVSVIEFFFDDLGLFCFGGG